MNPCCCMSLRTGSMVVAVLGIIGNSVGFLVAIFGIVGTVYLQDHPKEAKDAKVDLLTLKNLLIFLIISLILHIVRLTLSIILVIGIKKSSSSLVKKWVVVQVVTFVVSVCYIIALNVKGHHLIADNSISIFASLLTVYFIVIVYCFWSELKDNELGVQIFPPTTTITAATAPTHAVDYIAKGHV